MILTKKTFRRMVISLALICGVLFGSWPPLNGHAHPGGPRPVRLARAFNLKQGQEVQVKGSEIRFKLLAVEDSRCPRSVTCVWAGNGAVRLRFSLNRKSSQTMTLNTAKTPALPSEQEYGGYKVWLLALNPYPESAQGIKPNEYVATLMISRLRRR